MREASPTFAEDVRAGLCAQRKSLPARYLYDALGSALYAAITLLPEYYLTAAEESILARHAGAILERFGSSVQIVELGPGDGRKTRIVLEAALRRQQIVHYHPIDISQEALIALAERLTAEYDGVVVTPHPGDYREVLAGAAGIGTPTLCMFLGSSIGNYDVPEAASLLAGIARELGSDDALLLGTDLKKSPEVLELAYNDPGGVTAAFNRNILVRINRELGGEFDLDAFRFVVAYDPERASVDSFQESRVAQRVRIAAFDREIPFAAGERILTESSYKYDRESIARLAAAGGFAVTDAWDDEGHRFRVSLLRATATAGE